MQISVDSTFTHLIHLRQAWLRNKSGMFYLWCSLNKWISSVFGLNLKRMYINYVSPKKTTFWQIFSNDEMQDKHFWNYRGQCRTQDNCKSLRKQICKHKLCLFNVTIQFNVHWVVWRVSARSFSIVSFSGSLYTPEIKHYSVKFMLNLNQIIYCYICSNKF